MPNATDDRRTTRSEALTELLRAVKEIRCPLGRPQAWATEFSRGINAISAVLQNQIAQAKGRATPGKGGGGGTGRKGGKPTG